MTSDLLAHAPLGKRSDTPQGYDPGLLFPIPRTLARDELGLEGALPFMGVDTWTAFELGWLNPKGKPQVGMARIHVPCETPCMIESKSFKLYLNSFNDHRFGSADEVAQCITQDIQPVLWDGAATGPAVSVELISPEAFAQQRIVELEGLSLDRLDIDMDDPAGEEDQSLACVPDDAVVEEVLRSDLVRALCRVTGQPDWGSVQIRYVGRAIDQERLLRYLIRFRNLQEFHEPLCERIFLDVWQQCRPLKLQVQIRFTRRGGMDINPFRTSYPSPLPGPHRLARQ